jgi:hypothetical protein
LERALERKAAASEILDCPDCMAEARRREGKGEEEH